ncbi:MAG: type II/IV secretion system protein [Deltaproteobacteria bacterium]|nr:type II/IV secretion system protein [Deltaproteobacteria bacterium]
MLLGEILIDSYGVSPVDVENALKFQEKYGGLIGSILMNMGIITEETLVSALSEQLNIGLFQDIDRKNLDFQSPLAETLNNPFLLQRNWLPLFNHNGIVTFAAINPLNYEVIQYLRDMGVRWQPILATESQFRELQGEYEASRQVDGMDSLDVSGFMDAEVDKLRELASEAPIVNLVNTLISRAVTRGASDLHFEPFKNMYRVRFRIDGMLHDIDFLPLKMQLPIASRIKIISGMDIAERRRPQDGQISMKVSSKDIDVRVSTLPLSEGESLVLRFLIKESISYNLDYLGIEPDLNEKLQQDILKTAGVILLTGPTGSGKTTTLYSCLNSINSEDKKIITIEDPVEYRLNGINQIQVQHDIGYDFLTALRSILRQDPDVIMIGEIRDAETARVAMQSSLTGHLVFSTLHTNDAPTAYTRLIDLGLQEYLINSSMISVIAQRLVRKLCPECAVPENTDDATIRMFALDALAEKYGVKEIRIKTAKGCPLCNNTGYKGRVGIMEYLRCTQEIKAFPKNSSFPMAARRYMAEAGIRHLAEDGFLKCIKGITTMDEVLRVAG